MRDLGRRVKMGMKAFSDVVMGNPIESNFGIRGDWHIEHLRGGRLIHEQRIKNIIVNTGLDDALDKWLKGSAYTASFFVGLKDTGVPAAADTMASHVSWATITPYSNATDPALTLGAVSGQSVDNSASKAVFNINATDVVYGAFVKDNNTKGGATGLLVSVVDFAASRSVLNLDILNVTVTFTSGSV